AAAIADDAVVVNKVAARAVDQHADAEVANSNPLISTPWVSTKARPGLVVVRTLVPYWPGTAPGQVCGPLSSMWPEPSRATNSPLRFHGAPSIATGPLSAGSGEASLITYGA